MKITVLNGNPETGDAAVNDYVGELIEQLGSEGHAVTALDLREMDIEYCTGCFGCWVKTPGECKVPDDTRDVRRAVIQSDLALFASPVIMGYPSALLKRTTDKLLPLLLPYLIIVQGESHHPPRYDHYPVWGLLLGAGDDADDDDIEIISAIYGREALNAKSRLAFTKRTTDPIEEVAREASGI